MHAAISTTHVRPATSRSSRLPIPRVLATPPTRTPSRGAGTAAAAGATAPAVAPAHQHRHRTVGTSAGRMVYTYPTFRPAQQLPRHRGPTTQPVPCRATTRSGLDRSPVAIWILATRSVALR